MAILQRGNTKRRRIAAVGMYDGVHLGHRFLLDYLKLEAGVRGLTPSVVTFSTHPLSIVRPTETPPLLSSADERMKLLAEAGADDIILLDFNDKMRHMTARAFLSMLKKRFAIDALVVGFNNRFGLNRTQGLEQYREIGRKIGMEILEAPEYKGASHPISSSIIRRLIADGKIQEANAALGQPYSISGTVTEGAHLGRTIGYPTANISLHSGNRQLPAPGVYAVMARTPDGTWRKAMMNIGRRPTVDDSPDAPLSIEVHIFDFSGFLYNEEISLKIIAPIRDEKKYSSLAKLKSQLDSDAKKARKMLKEDE